MEKKDMIFGKCYVIRESNGNYNWITIHNGGNNNKESICFYDKDINKPTYLEKSANFGKNYQNFSRFIVREATLKEIAWLNLCKKEKKLIPLNKISIEEYSIY